MQAKNRSSQTSHTKSLFKVDGRRREWNIRRVDETAVPVEISAATIVLEGKSYLFAVLRDIREWKEAQLQLRRSKDELDKRVRERTADLATVNRQLKREIEAHKKTAVRMRTSREELRYLSEYLQKIREDERTGAAREVHDQLGQILSAVAIDLACLRKKLVSDQENWVSEQIQQIEGRIGETMRSVRDICAKLRPPNFEDFGLSTAIRWHLREYQDRTGILCSATIDDELSDIEKELGMVIFRIYQEAMTNIFRHADATRVTVILKRDQDRLLLKISDDGKGITAEQITSPRSYGVLGIRERVRFWGGKSRLEGVAGKGTTVEVILPLHPAQRLKRRASTENDIDW
jgi:signal transduction histidine kinase